MKNCKQAAESKCGKNCCCFFCEDQKDCKDACSMYDSQEDMETSGCEEAYDQESALTEFNTSAIAIMQSIADIAKQKEALEAKDKEVRQILKDKMEEFGIKSFDNDILKVTYVAPTTKTTIDSKALKKDHPDIAEKYSKTSNVSASVRISVK